MKNLANCSPTEFLVQTNKIRKAVASWLDATKVMEIRKNLPDLSGVEGLTERKRLISEQVKKNLSDMFDAALETNAEETVKLLGYMCFIEPDDVDNHSGVEYLGAFAEMIACPEIISFFTSLIQLVPSVTSDTAKASGSIFSLSLVAPT